MNKILDYITRGEWNCGIEESLYKRFFRIYRLQAIAMPDSRMEDIYNAVYVPFIIESGKSMIGIVNLFNSLPDAITLYYSKKRHDYLIQNKLKIKKHQIDNIDIIDILINDKFLCIYMSNKILLMPKLDII